MASAKRKMPVKTVTLDFTEDGYDGFHAERRTNAPIGLLRRYLETSRDTSEEEGREIMLALFPSWDFVDDDGKPIPHAVGGFDLIPADLVLAMHRRGLLAMRDGVMPAPLGTGSSGEPSEDERG